MPRSTLDRPHRTGDHLMDPMSCTPCRPRSTRARPAPTSATTGSTTWSGLRVTPATAPRSSRSSDGGSSRCSRPPTGRSSRTPWTSSTSSTPRWPPDRSAYPATAVLRTVAHLLELFGGEGLLRPAMHYRWDFDDVNVPFLAKDFSAALGGRRRRRHPRCGVRLRLGPDAQRLGRIRGDHGAGARDRAVLRGVPGALRRPPGRFALPPRWAARPSPTTGSWGRSTPIWPAIPTPRS